jgi:hypothetical protein
VGEAAGQKQQGEASVMVSSPSAAGIPSRALQFWLQLLLFRAGRVVGGSLFLAFAALDG